jgi:hypothetical protein
MDDLEAGAAEARRREAEAERESPWRVVLLVGSAVAFVLVMVLNVAPMFRTVEPLPAPEQEAALGAMAQMVVHRIEAYREARGELPPSLEALGLPLEGFAYSPMGEEYEVVARAGDVEVVFSSRDLVPILPLEEGSGESTTETGGDVP